MRYFLATMRQNFLSSGVESALKNLTHEARSQCSLRVKIFEYQRVQSLNILKERNRSSKHDGLYISHDLGS